MKNSILWWYEGLWGYFTFITLFWGGMGLMILLAPDSTATHPVSMEEKWLVGTGVLVALAFVWSAPLVLKELVNSDIRDIKRGKIWTPLGYRKLEGDPDENIKKYANGELKSDLK